MARQITTTIVDDIDGSTEDVRSVRISIPFEYAGPTATTEYRIDLGPKNREALRQALAPFVAHAERYTGYDPDNLRPGEGKLIREWAEKTQALTLKKGRIPKDIIAQYRRHIEEGG